MFKRKPLERSEKVRRKLDEESKTWINKASYQIANPNSSIGDLNGLFGSSDSTSAQPAKKVNRFFKVGWRLLSFLLVGAFSFALFTAWSSPEYKVNFFFT